MTCKSGSLSAGPDSSGQNESTNTRKDKVIVKLFLVERRAKRPLFAKKVQQLFLDSSLRAKFGAESTCL
jgi:hypothetical protein